MGRSSPTHRRSVPERRHPRATKRLLTLTRDGRPDDAPSDIIVQPAHEWMLGGDTG